MGILNRVKNLGDQVGTAATSFGKDVAHAVQRGVDAGRAGTNASGDWVLSVLRSLPAPAAPTPVEWEFSLGALICRHPKVPAITAKALRPLDGIGALRFGPESVGFDGEDIPWDKVVHLQLHDAFSAMTTEALDAEIDRIRDLLPMLPGRKWVVTKVVEGLASVMLAALEQAGEQRLETVNVACEITYRGALGMKKTLRANMFSTALLAQQAEVMHSLVLTAQAKGIPVLPAEPPLHGTKTGERVLALRARTDTVAAQLRAEQATEQAALDSGR
ncbi:hypothetical protein [Streptomyces telluris]|uniref:Uncharacterized protein n=1 Tax=Streptomyces telluris TaxID=2720021 RepID=A0A9X2RM74_9ACTN|nr:hypothetical protein [Streptomyces telluris]MCQ8770384.1 hypothetical protein [Streptomyces telluris]NJP77887.1 hypothetical protein [Streptomyces telluris]